MKKYLLLLTALFFTGCLNVIGIGETPKQDDSWQQPKDEKRAYGIYKVACFRGLNKACPQMKRLGAKLGM